MCAICWPGSSRIPDYSHPINTLDVDCCDDHGLSFDLLIDGKFIGLYLKDENGGIPYWLLTEGLPRWSPEETDSDVSVCLVTVCTCGEAGCGHSRCTVRTTEDAVIFEDFRGDVRGEARALRFVFSRADYERVLSLMTEKARAYRTG